MTQRRKLLTAAVGVATVSYVVACGGLRADTSGNLVAAGGDTGYGGAETSGNLVAAGGSLPELQGGSGGTAGYAGGETSGNLVAPPPEPRPLPPVDPGAGGSTQEPPDSGAPSGVGDAATDPAVPGDAAVGDTVD